MGGRVMKETVKKIAIIIIVLILFVLFFTVLAFILGLLKLTISSLYTFVTTDLIHNLAF